MLLVAQTVTIQTCHGHCIGFAVEFPAWSGGCGQRTAVENMCSADKMMSCHNHSIDMTDHLVVTALSLSLAKRYVLPASASQVWPKWPDDVHKLAKSLRVLKTTFVLPSKTILHNMYPCASSS